MDQALVHALNRFLPNRRPTVSPRGGDESRVTAFTGRAETGKSPELDVHSPSASAGVRFLAGSHGIATDCSGQICLLGSTGQNRAKDLRASAKDLSLRRFVETHTEWVEVSE